MAKYLFSVRYTRTYLNGKTVEGTTVLSSKRPNLGIVGAEKKLKSLFPISPTFIVNRVDPYMSGSDLVKARRRDKHV